MKSQVILFAIVMGVGCVGCERQLPEEPDAYDPETEAPPSALVVRTDPRVAKDQKAISDEAKKPPAGEAEAEAGEPAGEGEATTKPGTTTEPATKPGATTEPATKPAGEGEATTKPAGEGEATTKPAGEGEATTKPAVAPGAEPAL